MVLTQILIFALAFIAAYVAYGLYKKRVMWKWIVAYWLVLTIKNLVDFLLQIK